MLFSRYSNLSTFSKNYENIEKIRVLVGSCRRRRIHNKTLIFIAIPSSSKDENNEFELTVKNCVKNGAYAKLNHVCE